MDDSSRDSSVQLNADIHAMIDRIEDRIQLFKQRHYYVVDLRPDKNDVARGDPHGEEVAVLAENLAILNKAAQLLHSSHPHSDARSREKNRLIMLLKAIWRQ